MQKNVTFNFKDVENYCDEFFAQFTVEEWKSRCERAKRFEIEFMAREPMIDIIVEDLIINLNEDSDTDLESESEEEPNNWTDAEDDLSGVEELAEDEPPNEPSVSTIEGKTFLIL